MFLCLILGERLVQDLGPSPRAALAWRNLRREARRDGSSISPSPFSCPLLRDYARWSIHHPIQQGDFLPKGQNIFVWCVCVCAGFGVQEMEPRTFHLLGLSSPLNMIFQPALRIQISISNKGDTYWPPPVLHPCSIHRDKCPPKRRVRPCSHAQVGSVGPKHRTDVCGGTVWAETITLEFPKYCRTF